MEDGAFAPKSKCSILHNILKKMEWTFLNAGYFKGIKRHLYEVKGYLKLLADETNSSAANHN